ncbi:MAG: hypothetical protein CVV11_04385 [Gammaproteobacteria bacterium HGW-Gammaproteobacteria-15]|nr:MAG: hypothetical protein CVV11_04385 [Gammaproteobacteria bacterium HGW-Gammaproteobacteria-15]
MLAIRTTNAAPRLLMRRDIVLSFFGWAVFLTAAALYCILYTQFVALSTDTFVHSFIWGFREYAPWLVITPVLMTQLRRIHQFNNSSFVFRYAGLVMLMLSAALITRVGLEMYFNPELGFVAGVVDFFPIQVSVLAFLVIIWEWCLAPAKVENTQPPPAPSADEQGAPEFSAAVDRPKSQSVLVIKGNGERLIRWDSVEVICAAGNYIELYCADEKYLLRASMKQLEQDLPAGCFVRIHRSYMVNITAIDRIITQAAGNGVVVLRNSQQLPLSKSYKQALKAYKFATSQSV